MNSKRYHWILYLISFTILATIAVQVFWNYKNYQQNKQRVLNEIQISLDTAIEEYFADITKNSTIAFVDISDDSVMSKEKANAFLKKINFDTLFKPTSNKKIKKPKIEFEYFKNIKPNSISSISIFKGKEADSIGSLKSLTNKIVISISRDSIEFNKLNPYFEKQLNRKHISLPFGFIHYKGNTIKGKHSPKNTTWKGDIKMFSKSTYLKSNEKLELLINNPSKEALKRSLTGIFLSLLLSLAIISCLFYLLHIINKQKELAEIKNDLISNITHEFKTPITTVSAALEAIRSFNVISDQEKTKKYLSISTSQLKKLNVMVEKLLETATLDSEKLLLKKEHINIVELVQKVALKEEFITTKKNIVFHSSKEEIAVHIDSFHFENAISNLIDNAIKYGGDNIEVHISSVLNTIEISVADDGKPIEKNQQEKIFEQFYRIPKGNTHDVKGFGIGLYYTKKIIEKHGGQITIVPNTTYTIFKISMPL
ncbi:MAG: HAMP domain-containing sensor histidine kinase [Polaribacter sp.]|nr:HAMP domain-containing sensor histidine kinase [Polaribacter sp.]